MFVFGPYDTLINNYTHHLLEPSSLHGENIGKTVGSEVTCILEPQIWPVINRFMIFRNEFVKLLYYSFTCISSSMSLKLIGD